MAGGSLRVLVTGAGGVLGGVLVPFLRGRGHDVYGAPRGEDLAIPAAARRVVETVVPHAVVHLAGRRSGHVEALHRSNVLTVRNVVEAAGARPAAPHVVVLGSAAEYGEGGGEPIPEDAPLRPVSDYGRAKAAATTLARSLAADLDVPLTVARPFNVVAERAPRTTPLGNLSAQLLDQAGPVRVVRCGRLDVVRDFVPATFVTEVIARVIEGRHLGTYNVCSGVGISLEAVLRDMAALLGVEARPEPAPELLTLTAADRVVGDPTRLVAALGLRCTPTSRELARLCLGFA